MMPASASVSASCDFSAALVTAAATAAIARRRRMSVRAAAIAGEAVDAQAAKLKCSPSYVSKFEAERRLKVCEFIDLCAAVDGDAAEIVRRIMR
jgi:hypothetical protein